METSTTQIRNTQELGERTQAGIRNVLLVMEFLPKGTREQTDRVGDTRKRRQKGAKFGKLKPCSPVISATGKAEVGGSQVQGQARQLRESQ